jgi:hypothetical protein
VREIKNAYRSSVEKPKGRGHLEDTGMAENIEILSLSCAITLRNVYYTIMLRYKYCAIAMRHILHNNIKIHVQHDLLRYIDYVTA